MSSVIITQDEYTALNSTVEVLRAQLAAGTAERDALREALKTARIWGIAHGGYDAVYARQLAAWVDGGFRGPTPTVDEGGGV